MDKFKIYKKKVDKFKFKFKINGKFFEIHKNMKDWEMKKESIWLFYLVRMCLRINIRHF